MPLDRASFEQTRRRAQEALLASRAEPGDRWEGELSSSALSTATAIIALATYHAASRRATGEERKSRSRELVRSGIRWLVSHQNRDGGWGDTDRSDSNVSTTMLGWSALAVSGVSGERSAASASAAEAWLQRYAGSLEPEALARTIVERYGADRTFSVPILAVAAMTGRLGAGGWRRVPQLPFELAALPSRWFHWLRLPVVSYALPALIALGHVRHRHLPTRNPVLKVIRDRSVKRTLRRLERSQPSGGGFLEATPLTSFVVASLVGAGHAGHAVVARGVGFLLRSVREDGSWPIDTNLATWVTTLSVGALAAREDAEAFHLSERERVRSWLLAQQYREVHPYTGAEPGGWAWTDLPGGVPDADDTAGALLALRLLGPTSGDETTRAAFAGVRWLLNLQNGDGGMPTFCRGWGALAFDRSGADLTAHAVRAWAAWRDRSPPQLRARMSRAMDRALSYLVAAQREDGAWMPLWFGNQAAPEEENPTYGTARVVLALAELQDDEHPRLSQARERGVRWLIAAQNKDGGWGGDRDVPASIEETALAVQALARGLRRRAATPLVPDADLEKAVSRGAAWLVGRTNHGRELEPSPIGLYFAKLWYFERLYPVIFTLGAMNEAAPVLLDQKTSRRAFEMGVRPSSS